MMQCYEVVVSPSCLSRRFAVWASVVFLFIVCVVHIHAALLLKAPDNSFLVVLQTLLQMEHVACVCFLNGSRYECFIMLCA